MRVFGERGGQGEREGGIGRLLGLPEVGVADLT